MQIESPTESAARCASLLPRVDSGELDCVSDNLALLLAHAGLADVRTPFAVDWRFDLVRGPAGFPRIDLPPADMERLLGLRTGLAPRWKRLASLEGAVDEWRQELGRGQPVLAVGDAYHLPWVPYRGHQHLDHSFVVEGLVAGENCLRAQVVDAYDNATEWGRATPVATEVDLSDLAAAVERGSWAVLVSVGAPAPFDPAQQLAQNAAAILAADGAGSYREVIETHRAMDLRSLDSLALTTWLVARNRGLHARWLRDQSGWLTGAGLADLADRFEAEVVACWRRAAESAYIGLRRVRAGRSAPPVALAALETAAAAEPCLAASLARALDGLPTLPAWSRP